MTDTINARPHVNDVFVSNDPTYTYVDRTKSAAALEFLDEITQRGVVIGLHGPSQSGKTVLCRHLLADRHPILLRGRPIKTMSHFWGAVKAGLDTPTQRETHIAVGLSSSAKDQTGGNAGVTTPFVSFGASTKEEKSSATNSSIANKNTFDTSSEWHVMQELVASKRPLLLDDFHWMPEETVHEFLRTAKDLAFEGVIVVLVAIPEAAFSSIRNDAELDGGRRLIISAPIWKPSEIKRIAQKGFEALNMSIEPAVIDDLAIASYRNPLLMQKLCRALCIQLGISRALDAPSPCAVRPHDFAALYRKIAREAYDPYEAAISAGERAWKLPNGRLVTLRQLICITIHRININHPWTLAILAKRISRNFRISPSLQQLEEAMASMSDEFMRSREFRPPLKYDRSIQTLYVLEPDFRLALKWHLAEALGVH